MIWTEARGTPGHRGSAGGPRQLCDEAVRLARLLAGLCPEDPEVLGLLALLITDARRAARTSAAGHMVLLGEQDRDR